MLGSSGPERTVTMGGSMAAHPAAHLDGRGGSWWPGHTAAPDTTAT